MHYPKTRKDSVVDTYFGHDIADPYRWLEDDRSEETAQWVSGQNSVTFDFLGQIPYRQQIRDLVANSQNYEKYSQPFVRGDYTYFYKNDGLQNQSVLYRRKGEGEAEVFLDPNTFSEEGTTSLGEVSFSKDYRLVAYSISEGGSDWRKIFVIDTETKEQLEPEIVDAKFTSISWLGSKGFYYSSYDKPQGSELSARTEHHKLYYHELGTPQSEDKVIFGELGAQIHRYVSGTTTTDDRFLIISGAESTSGNRLFYIDLQSDSQAIVTLRDTTQGDTYLIDSQDETLLLYTNLDAPNGKVVSYNTQTEQWADVIAEQEQPLEISKGGGYLFATYMVDVLSKVQQFTYQGEWIRDVELPGEGTAYGLAAKKEETTLYYTFTNYVTPPTIFSFDVESGASTLYQESKAPFDRNEYESKQVFYTSKDGTQVPMIISYKKGISLDGSAPTMLYGYGGFNISLTPMFSGNVANWLELGGIYAVANMRGGGEYGKAWHNAGTQQQKQNVFNDFIAAAEYLIENDYTSSERLAIRGGSNGGLLVGACMTQRPELFKVALPAVGVLDMLRYHTFTSGEGWKYDYGTSEQSEVMFRYLLGYSPVHNVKEGVQYPATLVTTADHDDRVVPAHSYKFIAELQDKQQGENPVLIRIDVNAGHGAGMPLSKQIELTTDVYAFTLYNMGIESI
ncbi:TPA: prolyl oligopeptidase family serine peptidase [Vibrio parahaemolyticus]|uniref:prolyl oligopeptidase family serine peptidase n=1 Tax=Vibrio parahaemolyticus TaxID=670 RepID=UPI00146F1BE8|nr:prolyl oligopeptidase family serine peptidase [Vibrio parahaemolyticus]MDF4692897.1 prolyl oligopeptidase family serine peptidase [Vibrio parahaemolyticus]MDF4722640.1 prolyl oligopeptidase family serine peptidase [Vibrio parahaemolyticus]MDF5021064.1 prolyl oligopeptidase family serine peptidase [Vibrio parahaemolyticus]MDF5040399.1 prolyl oligopeptidase family serine peptidase [Vibrio parahaemolyticus]MDF5044576.1 prolyl oligopeptidase family serine peptidase [Vibrio parahaemolyticus]